MGQLPLDRDSFDGSVAFGPGQFEWISSVFYPIYYFKGTVGSPISESQWYVLFPRAKLAAWKMGDGSR